MTFKRWINSKQIWKRWL